jgi:hypothetical protein
MYLEEEYINKLKTCSFNFEEQKIHIIENYFINLREIEQLIWKKSPEQLFQAQWSLLGIISRSYQLSLSSVQQIYSKNFNGYYCSVRGLMESLAVIIWANEKNDRLKALVEFTPLNIGKIMNAAYRKYPKLKKLYSVLSKTAHPNRNSHLLGHRNKQDIDNGMIGFMTPFEMSFSDDFAKDKIEILLLLCQILIFELKNTIHTNIDIYKGKVMASIKKND